MALLAFAARVDQASHRSRSRRFVPMEQLDLPEPLANVVDEPVGAARREEDGAHHAANEPVDFVGVVGPVGPQIDLPAAPLALVSVAGAPKHAHRSAEAVQHARSQLQLQRTQAKLEATTAKAENASTTLQLVASILPGANKLLGNMVKRKRLEASTATPKDFCALALVVFMPLKSQPRTGVRFKRLVCAVAGLIALRQRKAWALVLASARLYVRPQTTTCRSTWIAVAYSHEWDETRSFFRNILAQKGSQRMITAGQHVETLVQRGTFTFALCDFSADRRHNYSEEWLVPPQVVQGTAASDLHPGLVRHLPQGFQWEDTGSTMVANNAVDILVFLPMGDKSSANCAIMKRFADMWRKHLAPVCGNKLILLLPDFCQVHSHHRAKCALLDLKKHVSRHFSIGHMYRLPNVHRELFATVESFVRSRFRREERAAAHPSAELTRAFFDTIFHLQSGFHKRSSRPSSKLVSDIELYLSMANGDRRGGELVHHCVPLRGGASKRCCANAADAEDKYITSVANLVVGSADRIPTESRWTNMLPAMKKTLVRRFLHNLGLQVVCQMAPHEVQGGTTMDDEAQASADYFKIVNGTRARRAREYLEDERMIAEVAAFTIIMDTADALLYALLGGVERSEPPCKVEALVSRGSSLVGEVQSRLMALLEGPGCATQHHLLAEVAAGGV